MMEVLSELDIGDNFLDESDMKRVRKQQTKEKKAENKTKTSLCASFSCQLQSYHLCGRQGCGSV